MTAEFVQRDYRRSSNPFVAGQIATGKEVHIDTGRLLVGGSDNYPATLPFGYAVGWVDGPSDPGSSSLAGSSVQNPYLLKGHACARHYTQTSNVMTNFGGVAIRNVALPGAGTQVQGADAGTNRVVDAYNQNDLVSIGAEGDFVVVCRTGTPTSLIRTAVYVTLTDTTTGGAANVGSFTNAASVSNVTKASVPGAIFMTDAVAVTPYGTTPASNTGVLLAVVRIQLQPRR